MRIYSMTATFGKLEHQTLTLQPGLNILSAPNEWGKSTWCAFLVAMFYGMDTRLHTTKTALADKDRYAPWSGSPMSGSIDLCWQGRDITIQRRTRGRIPMGEFSAFETHTGLAVEELAAGNCGQVLLGVEKSVFLRCAFLRGSELVVTQDESLRRRLNALVTTGDDSGTADVLEKRLRELKNRCRSNRVNGLIPQALAEKARLQQSLDAMQQLHGRCAEMEQREQILARKQSALVNHRQALEYAADLENRQRLESARAAQEQAAQLEEQLDAQCAALPPLAILEQELRGMQTLRAQQEGLQAQLSRLPDEEEGDLNAVRQDTQRHQKMRTLVLTLITLGCIALCAGIGLLLLPALRKWGIVFLAMGLILLICHVFPASRIRVLRQKYAPVPPDQWIAMAREQEQQRLHRRSLEELLSQQYRQIQERTGGMTPEEYEQQLTEQRALRRQLLETRREHQRCAQLTQALETVCRQVEPPAREDRLSYTSEETVELLAACGRQLNTLRVQIGSCRGQLEALGEMDDVRQELLAVNRRIAQLEDTYAALELAHTTLLSASDQLQRRFAPKIAKRAQELFGSLTSGRYQKLTLDSELQLNTAACGEDTLRSSLWRSEGTVDQLHLALRLAVAQELTPHSPLILDDALVRFDDRRLSKAMEVLRKEAEHKQILLFTCSSREESI